MCHMYLKKMAAFLSSLLLNWKPFENELIDYRIFGNLFRAFFHITPVPIMKECDSYSDQLCDRSDFNKN